MNLLIKQQSNCSGSGPWQIQTIQSQKGSLALVVLVSLASIGAGKMRNSFQTCLWEFCASKENIVK